MYSSRRVLLPLLTLSLLLSGCAGSQGQALQASGLIEAIEVSVAPEIGGRIVEVLVEEGDRVQVGDPLLRLESDLLSAQRRQAESARDAAQAALQAAQTGEQQARAAVQATQAAERAAQAQYDLQLQLALQSALPERAQAWNQNTPAEFDLPPWYFDQPEAQAAARAAVDQAQAAVEEAQQELQRLIAEYPELQQAEARLAAAQAAFDVAKALRDRTIRRSNAREVYDAVQSQFDAAKAELDQAQAEYDRALTERAAQDVKEARARLSVARERYRTALDQWAALQSGDNAPSVRAAQAGLEQAQAAVLQAQAGLEGTQAAITQARKALEAAQAQLDLVELQTERLTIRAPVDGVVLVRNVEAGELLQAGMPALTLAQVDRLTVTVYIPESRYGEVSLGQQAELRVDSFPDLTFQAQVVRIADQAEFTPRNVQTREERQATVYAVELAVEDPQGLLKPGMPADVTFQE